MNELNLPRHIGFIMDGNGRWAKKRNKPRNFGHVAGADRVEDVATWCYESGINAVTLYAFSTENWGRPQDEVDKIMSLLIKFLNKYTKTLIKNEIRLLVSGDKSKLSSALQEEIAKCQKLTENFKVRTLNIALNYGSRQEIVNAVNTLIKNGKTEISEDDLNGSLYTSSLPDIDLVVRTSGEQRLSNFCLWQSAYAELYFTDALWPDFDKAEFDKAIKWYSERNRRFGKL